jgi:hypothetical protein
MKRFDKNIDNMISQILKEEIELKSKEKAEEVENEWMEIVMDEELHGDQDKLDVAKPKGVLTKADFKKLGSSKKEEVEENMYYDDLSDLGDYEGDEEAEEKAEKLSQKEPRYRGTRFASFNDEDWFDEHDYPYSGKFDFDFEEEQFDEFEPFNKKYGKKVKWFSPDESGRTMFNRYRDKFGPLKIRFAKDLDEGETQEGNKFSGELDKARKQHKKKFKVDGETYPVKESKEKWIQKTKMNKGALHKKLGVAADEKIPVSKLKSMKKELMKKGEGDKKLTSADSKLLKQVNLALTLKDIKESNKSKLTLTEDEFIDMIEKIVNEEKNTFQEKKPEGLKKTERVLNADKKTNDNYAKEVVKKMTEYLKNGSEGKFDMNPETFPENNYQLGKMKEKTMKYHPSDAVDEYIEAFAFPGQTNLVFDEIKPDDEKIKKHLKGDSTTGNATKDKEGKALGNVVPSEVGERFMKNFEDNLYGAEQMNVSYKRQPQPVDVGGTKKMEGSLKSIRKGSTGKAQKIMNQLESKDSKKQMLIQEDMKKMKSMIGYNTKTQ